MKSELRGIILRRTALGLGRFLILATALLPLPAAAADLAGELKGVAHKIVYETWQGDNWELFVASADGSQAMNLTKTPGIHELYPHVSPDGKKICFVCDEGEGTAKIRNVYYMNLDGTGRTLVATNARQPCWKADSTAIAYLKGEFEKFSYTDYATNGIVVYDLATGRHREHPNTQLRHLYNLCWSPDGKWFLATVHAGMGYGHAILAIEADGPKVFDLKIPGCRPDISPDGKRIAWGPDDWVLRVGDLDTTGPQPKVTNARDVVTSAQPMKVYHIDWSPDGKYVTYSRGPAKKRLGLIPEIVGVRAEGWDIYVADPAETNRSIQITRDGNCNKEPDWVPVEEAAR
jgi:Tol biopolymer transport system component